MSSLLESRLALRIKHSYEEQARAYRINKIEVPRDVRNTKGPYTLQVQERMVSTLEQMQVPNGTGPGVRRSKRPLLASRTRCNVLWKPHEIW